LLTNGETLWTDKKGGERDVQGGCWFAGVGEKRKGPAFRRRGLAMNALGKEKRDSDFGEKKHLNVWWERDSLLSSCQKKEKKETG